MDVDRQYVLIEKMNALQGMTFQTTLNTVQIPPTVLSDLGICS